MISPNRKKKIVALLSAKNFYQLAELAKDLGTSVSTTRRDLNELEQDGIVKRTHGGVMFLGAKNSLPIFGHRQETMSREKEAIGIKAAQIVEDGDTVIIDGGTTPYQVALHLQNKSIQVVTNSMPVANIFADSRNVQTIVTGGILFPGTGVFLGSFAEQMIQKINAQKAFIGVSGLTQDGLYNSNALVVDTEKRMIEAAKDVFIVADHTKFDRRSLAFLQDFSNITGLITDSMPTEQQELEESLNNCGVEITLAK